jgi:kynurenine formamidase
VKSHRLVELSHAIRDGMVTMPNLPAPQIDEFLTREASRERYAPGTEFSIGRITMVANTGTYLDTPFHRYADGVDLAGMPLERFVDLEALLIHAGAGTRGVGVESFEGIDVAGRAVLIHTGWSQHWGSDTYGNGQHGYLTREGAEWLVARRVALVGIDSQNIDDTSDASRPSHTVLLAAGIPIVEHLTNLDQLPDNGFRFTAAPPRVQGMGTWPVRAYATIETP